MAQKHVSGRSIEHRFGAPPEGPFMTVHTQATIAESMPAPLSEYDPAWITVLGERDVRQRPSLYIGDVNDGSGLHNMVCGVVENAISEEVVNVSPSVEIKLNPDGSVAVRDHGLGRSMALHKSDFSRKSDYPPGGLHTISVFIASLLSTKLQLRIWRSGREHYVAFADGEIVTSPTVLGRANGQRGTEVTFTPSPQIFTTIEPDFATLKRLLRKLAVRNPGVRIVLSDMRHAVEKREEMRYDGIKTLSRRPT
jgi:DNA gyrase subunit B